MGLKFFKLTPSTTDSSNRSSTATFALGEPRPYRFSVVRSRVVVRSVVVEIHYPDCTEHAGNKILVYDSWVKFKKLQKSGNIDPHFLERAYSPVARFEPTPRGWDLALKLAAEL